MICGSRSLHMLKVIFRDFDEVADELYKYAVIVARYDGKWIFSRHRERDTWEIPGGHREAGETIEQTARRELYEETGAVDADVMPVTVYGVVRDGVPTFGVLFFADVKALDPIPDGSEIAEIDLYELIPQNLTYTAIQPPLFRAAQGWLNGQCGKGEIWDIYDENRTPTGRTVVRGETLARGDYHLVVHVWIINSSGEYLLTKRAPNKGFPNMWEATGGSAVAGDDSLTAALREVKEETGLTLTPDAGRIIHTYKGRDHITDVWLFRADFDLSDVILQEGETCGAMYASEEQIRQMDADGTLVPFRYLDVLFGGADRQDKPSLTRKCKIALAACPFINNNVGHNVRAITDVVDRVGGECDLVLFGEAVLQGFDSLLFDYETDKDIAVTPDDHIIDDIRDAAIRQSVAVSFGYIERDGNSVYSSQLVIGQNGETLHNYRRVSPGWKEHRADFHYREGESFDTFDYADKRFAIALCGDLWQDGRTDEIRALGADVVLWPVYCDYDSDEWNSTIKHEYAKQASTAADNVLLVNPICADPMLLDLLSEPPVLAKGGATHFCCGKIASELPAGSDGVIIVEV